MHISDVWRQNITITHTSYISKRPWNTLIIPLLLPIPTHSPLNILSTHQINQRIKAGMISGLSSWIPSFYLSSHCKPKAGQIRVLVSRIWWALGCALFSTAQPIVQLMFHPIDVPMRLPVTRRHSLAISTASSILWGFVTAAGKLLLSNVAYL